MEVGIHNLIKRGVGVSKGEFWKGGGGTIIDIIIPAGPAINYTISAKRQVIKFMGQGWVEAEDAGWGMGEPWVDGK